MRLMACRVLVSAFLDSTWALVERVIKGYLPLRLSFASLCRFYGISRAGTSHVRAIDNSPPPAPASACATLSLCCEAMAWPAGDPKGAFWA